MPLWVCFFLGRALAGAQFLINSQENALEERLLGGGGRNVI